MTDKDLESSSPTSVAKGESSETSNKNAKRGWLQNQRCYVIILISLLVVVGAVIGVTVGLSRSSATTTATTAAPLKPSNPSTLPHLPVVESFLFAGYNLLKGNPRRTGDSGNDPGFESSIFAASYTNGRVSDGNRYTLPDGVEYKPADNCAISFSATTIETINEYSERLAASATVSASTKGWGVKARFSASTDYEKTKNVLETATSTMVQSEAACTVYETFIQAFNPPPFSDNFIAGLQLLPEEYDEDVYYTFLEEFGTHYVTSASMGAMYGEQSFVSESGVRELEKQGLTLSASAKASGYGSSLEASGMVSEETEKLTAFRKVATSRTAYSRGSKIPVEGGSRKWANSIFENPQPLDINLARIDSIFGLDKEVRSSSILENLKHAIDEYCIYASSTNDGIQCDPSQFDFSDFSVPTHQNGNVVDFDSAFGVLQSVVICEDNSYVMDVEFSEQTNVGFVNAALICSDNSRKTLVETRANIAFATKTGCGDVGIDELRPYGQVHSGGNLEGVYNIVGMEYSCTGDFARHRFGYLESGNEGEETRLTCPVGQRITGMQAAVAEGSDLGFTRLRLVCGEIRDA